MPTKQNEHITTKYEVTSLIFIGLVCLYVITWYLQVGKRIGFLGAIRFEFILGVALIGASFLQKKRKKYCDNPFQTILIFYFAALITQVPFSFDVAHSWGVFIRVVKFAMLALFLCKFMDSPRGLWAFLAAYLLAAFKLGLEGFVGWMSGSMVWENQGVMRLHGSTGLLHHPNSFSGFAVGLLPFLYFLFPLVGRVVKLIFLVLFVFCMIIVIFTASRAGYIAVLGLFTYVFIVSKNKKKLLAVLAIVGVVAVNTVPVDYYDRFLSSFAGKEKSGNSKGKRLEILVDAVDIFAKYPLGVGVGAFPAARIEIFGRFQDTHNLYMEVLTNLGIQGFIVFIILIYLILKVSGRNRKRAINLKSVLDEILTRERSFPPDYIEAVMTQKREIQLMLALSLSVLAYIYARIFLGMFGHDLYEIYWWVAIGISLTVHRVLNVIEQRTSELVADRASLHKH